MATVRRGKSSGTGDLERRHSLDNISVQRQYPKDLLKHVQTAIISHLELDPMDAGHALLQTPGKGQMELHVHHHHHIYMDTPQSPSSPRVASNDLSSLVKSRKEYEEMANKTLLDILWSKNQPFYNTSLTPKRNTHHEARKNGEYIKPNQTSPQNVPPSESSKAVSEPGPTIQKEWVPPASSSENLNGKPERSTTSRNEKKPKSAGKSKIQSLEEAAQERIKRLSDLGCLSNSAENDFREDPRSTPKAEMKSRPKQETFEEESQAARESFLAAAKHTQAAKERLRTLINECANANSYGIQDDENRRQKEIEALEKIESCIRNHDTVPSEPKRFGKVPVWPSPYSPSNRVLASGPSSPSSASAGSQMSNAEPFSQYLSNLSSTSAQQPSAEVIPSYEPPDETEELGESTFLEDISIDEILRKRRTFKNGRKPHHISSNNGKDGGAGPSSLQRSPNRSPTQDQRWSSEATMGPQNLMQESPEVRNLEHGNLQQDNLEFNQHQHYNAKGAWNQEQQDYLEERGQQRRRSKQEITGQLDGFLQQKLNQESPEKRSRRSSKQDIPEQVDQRDPHSMKLDGSPHQKLNQESPEKRSRRSSRQETFEQRSPFRSTDYHNVRSESLEGREDLKHPSPQLRGSIQQSSTPVWSTGTLETRAKRSPAHDRPHHETLHSNEDSHYTRHGIWEVPAPEHSGLPKNGSPQKQIPPESTNNQNMRHGSWEEPSPQRRLSPKTETQQLENLNTDLEELRISSTAEYMRVFQNQHVPAMELSGRSISPQQAGVQTELTKMISGLALDNIEDALVNLEKKLSNVENLRYKVAGALKARDERHTGQNLQHTAVQGPRQKESEEKVSGNDVELEALKNMNKRLKRELQQIWDQNGDGQLKFRVKESEFEKLRHANKLLQQQLDNLQGQRMSDMSKQDLLQKFAIVLNETENLTASLSVTRVAVTEEEQKNGVLKRWLGDDAGARHREHIILDSAQELNCELIDNLSKTEGALADFTNFGKNLLPFLEEHLAITKSLAEAFERSSQANAAMKDEGLEQLEGFKAAAEMKRHQIDELASLNKELLLFAQQKEDELAQLKHGNHSRDSTAEQEASRLIHQIEETRKHSREMVEIMSSLEYHYNILKTKYIEMQEQAEQKAEKLPELAGRAEGRDRVVEKAKQQLHESLRNGANENGFKGQVERLSRLKEELQEKLGLLENEVFASGQQIQELKGQGLMDMHSKEEEADAIRREAGDVRRRMIQLEKELLEKQSTLRSSSLSEEEDSS